MKVLTNIMYTNTPQKLPDLLSTLNQATGFTFSHIERHGIEIENGDLL
jgi:nitrogen regulatory protein P-II 1